MNYSIDRILFAKFGFAAAAFNQGTDITDDKSSEATHVRKFFPETWIWEERKAGFVLGPCHKFNLKYSCNVITLWSRQSLDLQDLTHHRAIIVAARISKFHRAVLGIIAFG